MKHWLSIWIVVLGICCGAGATEHRQELQRAAERGDLLSQIKLAYQLISTRQYSDAVVWLEKAQGMGSVEATGALGAVYAMPDFKGFDEKKAFGLFAKAADRGNAQCQFLVATYFDKGDVVTKSPKDVVKWLRLSAGNGYGPAQVRLAELYEKGVPGVLPKNLTDAFTFYRKALDTATGEISSFRDPKELLDQLERIKKTLAPSDLKLASSKRNAIFTDPLPEWTERTKYVGNGSGFIITKDGYIVSNYHVVKEGTTFLVKTAYGISKADVKAIDLDNDLALLKVDGVYSPAPVVNSDNFASVGSRIFVYGYPAAHQFGQEEPKYVEGNIGASDFVRGIEGADNGRNLGFTAPITGGNSGGALFDTRGNVIGVVVSGGAVFDRGSPYSTYQAIKSVRLIRFLDKNTQLRNALPPPVLVDRATEEVVAEARQAVVLIGAYYSAFDFVSLLAPQFRERLYISVFEKRTGKKVNEDNESEFIRFSRELPPKDVQKMLTEILKNQSIEAGWYEHEVNEALERLQKELRL